MLVQDPKVLQRDLANMLSSASDSSIPQIIAQDSAGSELRLSLQIDAEMACFRGHFPGNPVLPGVVQLQWAVEVSRLLLHYVRPPRQILRLKFKSIVVPPKRIELQLTQRTAINIAFTYFSEGKTYSQGLLRFDENAE